MGDFGRCSLSTTSYSTTTGTKTLLRVQKLTLPEAGRVTSVKFRVYMSGAPFCTVDNGKALIYDDSGGAPNALKAVSGATTWYKADGKQWVEFTFPGGVELDAGDYWFGVVNELYCGYYADILTAGGSGFTVGGSGTDWYNDPPTTFPGGASTWATIIYACATYEVTSNTYPVGLLKKGLASGYHCFMNAYINAKIAGYDPLKLPDGTPL